MLVRKEDAKEVQNDESCTVWEYNLASEKMGFAFAHIRGRYPRKGYVYNEVSELLYIVVAGSGVLECEGKRYDLKKDCVFLIKPKSRYSVKGDLYVAIPSAPPFSGDQHRQIAEL